MATGMQMMMEKMLGVNPEELKQQTQAIAQQAREVMEEFKAQLNRIEGNQQALYHLMLKAGVIEALDKPDEPEKDKVNGTGIAIN
jgi:hypothetical protein